MISNNGEDVYLHGYIGAQFRKHETVRRQVATLQLISMTKPHLVPHYSIYFHYQPFRLLNEVVCYKAAIFSIQEIPRKTYQKLYFMETINFGRKHIPND